MTCPLCDGDGLKLFDVDLLEGQCWTCM